MVGQTVLKTVHGPCWLTNATKPLQVEIGIEVRGLRRRQTPAHITTPHII